MARSGDAVTFRLRLVLLLMGLGFCLELLKLLVLAVR